MQKIKTYIVLCVLFFSCKYDHAEKSIFILPENYQGMVLIVYDVDSGEEVEYDKNGARIYRIPKSGILETKFTHNRGISEIPRFFYEDSGKELHYMMPSDWKDEKYKNSEEIIVAGMTTGNNKKSFLCLTIKSINNDSIGRNVHRKRLQYFKERRFEND